MSGLWFVSWRRLRHDRLRSAILVACLAMAMFLPLVTSSLVTGFERELVARAAATPMIVGAKGSRFDLALGALYFRANDLAPIPWSQLEELSGGGEATCVPLHTRFLAQGHPVVGTTPEYHELRGLGARVGSLPLLLGEAALGAAVAEDLGLGPGDSLFSDPPELYDIARPPALKMTVSGVLAATGGPDDHALFVDVKTCWILEGLTHGHDDPKGIDESLVIARGQDAVSFSPALIEHNEVTLETLAGFHAHASPDTLPLTSILVVPRDAKAGTLIKSRVNASQAFQALVPSAVIDELLGFVFRIKALLDSFTALLILSTLAMCALVVLLSVRIRAAETRTLARLGVARGVVLRLVLSEVVLLLGASAVLALAGAAAALLFAPGIEGLLR